MSMTTAGFSDAARSVDDYRRQEVSWLRNSEAFGLNSRLYEELAEVWGDCQQENWDGHSALPVSRETLRNAYELLEMLPSDLPTPSISAEADGLLTLEWYCSPTRLLSVSISPENELHYAALFGLNRTYGTEIVFGQWPSTILEMIKKVYG